MKRDELLPQAIEIVRSDGKTNVICWVAVTEQTPEIGQWLLVYAPSGRYIAWYNGYQFEDRADCIIEEVTHWMKIPEPPCI